MATKQSTYFKGNARKELPQPMQAGVACEVIVSHTFTEDVASTDVLELIPFIPFGRILSAEMITENVGAINLGVGLMTGVPGDTTAVRTCGTQIFAAQAANAVGATTLLAMAGLAKNGDTGVSIGMVPASAITAAANKKLHLRVRYTVGS